ncbi:hypothetical protein Pse7367_2090 [Thalassoporum mexicanum PCC 7367]|uniref:contractile injection system tape measure protein n=1 Tax=Thalassoporum mexicanum TaxID=3457544 RepID=UPI00029FFF8F|nr:contractile injection system tape measure protein [Pseudanabaena sp. PCC 7367]AFY70358.1 hypothetical protein Pse7367_2090 [Pseudanabaena sp. PCC 7367]
MTQHHIIGQISLEVETPNSIGVWELQEALSQVLQKAIPDMALLFDRWVAADQIVRLDELVIDLPSIDPHKLADEFVPQLLAALDQVLADRLFSPIPHAAPTNILTQADKESDWTLFLYFLEYGRLPWWRSPETFSSWLSLWEVVLQSDLSWRVPLQRLLLNQLAARQRLVSQLPDTFRQRLILQMQPAWVSWPAMLDSARTLMQLLQIDTPTLHYLEQHAWLALFAKSQPNTPVGATFPTSQWLHTWLPELIAVIDTDHYSLQTLINNSSIAGRSFWLAAIDDLTDASQDPPCLDRSSQSQSTQHLAKAKSELLAQIPTDLDSADLEVIVSSETPISLELTRSSETEASSELTTSPEPLETNLENDEQPTESLSKVDLSPEQSTQSNLLFDQSLTIRSDDLPHSTPLESAANPADAPVEPISADLQKTTLSSTPIEPLTNSQTGPQANISSIHPLMSNQPKQAIAPILSQDEIANGIYLNNAGLVLLHPFLRIYFEDVGLLIENTFRHEYAQQQAIALLHYLATGQTNVPEYELVLPKLVCGWPLNEPTIGSLELPEAALAEAENLLQTVINYWEVLKNTSIEGLREGFLQRRGKLTRTEMGDWKLRVEQQSIDILLSRLPWGLSMVKLPWMVDILVVEWI